MGQPESPLGTRAPLAALVSSVVEQNAGLSRIQREISELRGEGRAAGGRVVVEVAPDGAMTDLRIDHRAMRLGAEELAEEILAADYDARLEVSDQVQDRMRPLLTELLAAEHSLREAPERTEVRQPDMSEMLAALEQLRRQLDD